MSSKIECYDDKFTGQIHHPKCLRFEDGCVKTFKIKHNILGGQKLVVIGIIENYQLCLNVTKVNNTKIFDRLKRNNQIMELTLEQTSQIYRNPIPNTYIRFDHIVLFKDIFNFETISFRDELVRRFKEVSHMSIFNPMNLKDSKEIKNLPKNIIERFCEESKIAIKKEFGISYDELNG